MLLFTLRRILQTVPTIGAVVLVIFILFNVIPGSFATMQQDESVGFNMTQGYTIEAWIKPNDANQSGAIQEPGFHFLAVQVR